MPREEATDEEIIRYFVDDLIPIEGRIYDTNGFCHIHTTDDGAVRTWVKREGGRLLVRHEMEEGSELWDANTGKRAEEAGRGWGDGRVVASMPLSLLTSPSHPFAGPWAEGDMKGVLSRLEDSDYAKVRTREGKLV